MKKDASILEGGISRKFVPVNKVKIKKTDTNDSTWIPEDSIRTKALNVTKNGIYYAVSEDYTAYSSATVNVSTETEIDYEKMIEEYDFSGGGDGGGIDGGGIGSITGIDDINSLNDLINLEGFEDADLTDIENLILDGINENADSITGIDPETYEPHEIRRDENGNLEESRLPSGMVIVVPPTKLEYTKGETIDFSGIHCYIANGYTSPEYPTGEIPFSELEFPDTIAQVDDTKGAFYADFAGVTPNPFAFGHPLGSTYFELSGNPNSYGGAVLRKITQTVSGAAYAVLSPQPNGLTTGYFGASIYASNEPGAAIITTIFEYYDKNGGLIPEETTTSTDTYSLSEAWAYDNRTVYYFSGGTLSLEEFPEDTPTGNHNQIAWMMVYAAIEKYKTQQVPVVWQGYTDYFTITYGTDPGTPQDPEDNPYYGYRDVDYDGHAYNLNRKKVPPIQHANGYFWQEGISTEYTTEQAIEMGWLILIR